MDPDQFADLEENIVNGADGSDGPDMEGLWDDVYDNEEDEVPEAQLYWDDSDLDADDSFGHLISSDEEDSLVDEWTEYFNWEEDFFVSNRFLTNWSVIQMHKPGQIPLTYAGNEGIPRSNSIIGPSWERMKAARMVMTKEENENERVSYEQLYKLSVQNVKMLSAWKKRKEKTKASWDAEKVEELVSNLREDPDMPFVCHTGMIQEAQFVESNMYMYIVSEMMSPTERVKYSVGKLMQMLGTSAQLEALTSELNQVKNWLFSQMMKSLNSCLPVSLPYPAMTSLFKALYNVNNSAEENSTPQLGFMDSSDAIQLVEEKYLVRLYLSMVDVYNVLREIMFKHPALTRPADFNQTFQFMRSIMVLNLNSMKMLTTGQAEELKTCFYLENDLYFENKSIESSTSVTDVSLLNGFIVTITDQTKLEDGLYRIQIFNTETGKVESQFPVAIKPCSDSTKCNEFVEVGHHWYQESRKVCGLNFKCSSMVDDIILLSSGCPRLVLINWKKGEIQEEIIAENRKVNVVSKHREKVWIVQGGQDDPMDFCTTDFLEVFEVGKKGSKLEFGWNSKPTIITVMKNWLVVSTNMKCDEQNLKSVQWINLHTCRVISEDLYPIEKFPRITFDSSHRDCNEESIKFVQINDLGMVEIWKIEESGQKEVLKRFENGKEKLHHDNLFISYSHPHLLLTSKSKFMREDFEIVGAHKVSLYELNANIDERHVIFYSNFSVKMCGFYMFEFPVGKLSMYLGEEGLVMMTKTKTMIKQRVPFGKVLPEDSSDKLQVKWSRFNFGKGGLGVILEDIKMAEEVLENIQKEKLHIQQSTEILEDKHVQAASQLPNIESWKEWDVLRKQEQDGEDETGKPRDTCGVLGWRPPFENSKVNSDLVDSEERICCELVE